MGRRQIERNKKIAVAVSGGVDSGVALFLLKEGGYEVVAVWTDYFECRATSTSSSCCGLDSVRRAGEIAEFLNVPFYKMDFKKEFSEYVIKPFIEYYNRGRTPNPCVWCNTHLRFSRLLDRLKKMGIEYLATGHYAKIVNGRLYRATDKSKDQSYFLYDVEQRRFNNIIFPLGVMKKKDVRKIAGDAKLPVYTAKESQDCCLLMEDNLRSYLMEKVKMKEGEIVNSAGCVIGRHPGYQNFTLGQKSGLGGLEKKMYVVDIIVSENKVVVGEEDKLYKSSISIKIDKKFAEVLLPKVCEGEKLTVKLRSTQPPAECKVVKLDFKNNICKIKFNKPQRAPTPGQSAVFYREDEVIGGGEIIK